MVIAFPIMALTATTWRGEFIWMIECCMALFIIIAAPPCALSPGGGTELYIQ